MKQALGFLNLNMNKKYKISIGLLAVTAIAVQMISIYVASGKAIDSITATELRSKIESIREDNIAIESNILTFASYTAVASRAASIGFEETKEFVSLYDPVEVAVR